MEENLSTGRTAILIEGRYGEGVPSISDVLEKKHYHVVRVDSILEAVDEALDYTGAVHPELIVLDGDSPASDELGVLRLLRDTRQSVTVIALVEREADRYGGAPLHILCDQLIAKSKCHDQLNRVIGGLHSTRARAAQK